MCLYPMLGVAFIDMLLLLLSVDIGLIILFIDNFYVKYLATLWAFILQTSTNGGTISYIQTI